MSSRVLRWGSASSSTSAYLYYSLFVLMLVNALSVADRQILGILLELIRKDFDLTDTQLGLLTGPAFGAFYVTLGIPIARLADRRSRRNVIAVSLALWSGFTAACGVVSSYVQLLSTRIGVGVGEAGCTPPSHSLIAAWFPVESRATALAIFGIGAPVGAMLGNAVGGAVAATYGWRMAFLAFGIPGVLLALVVWATLREPARGHHAEASSDDPPPELFLALSTLWRRRAFRFAVFGAASHSIVTNAYMSFLPAFFLRTHAFDLRELGLYLGVILGITGAIGAIVGGQLSDRYGRRDPRWYAWVAAFSMAASLPLALVMLLADDRRVALGMAGASAFCSSMFMGPTFAIVQNVVVPPMRALASAVMMFVVNAIGYGLGPLIVGVVSDALGGAETSDSLRFALVAVFCVNVVSGVFYLFAAPHVAADAQAAGEGKA